MLHLIFSGAIRQSPNPNSSYNSQGQECNNSSRHNFPRIVKPVTHYTSQDRTGPQLQTVLRRVLTSLVGPNSQGCTKN